MSAVKRQLAVRACRAVSKWSQAKVCSLQQHPPCLVGPDASPFGFVPPCLCLWCGQPDRAFLCLCVVWSAGQSLSVSLCGVVSRTEPFRVSVWCGQPDRAFPTLRAPLSGTFLQTLPDLVTPLKGHSLSPRDAVSAVRKVRVLI